MKSRRARYSVLSTQYWVLVVVAAVGQICFAAPPKVNNLFPAGCQRGQSITITAAGEFSNWPVNVWADRAGLSVTAEKDKGKFKVDVATDAGAGVYWLRMHDQDGASVPRPFVVGTLSEIVESEPNDGPEKVQTVEPRVVVNGKLGKTGDVDGYRCELKQGQTLVASLAANSVLGAPMDAVLQVCELVSRTRSSQGNSSNGSSASDISAGNSARTAEAYVVAQNHDGVGLDPRMAFTAQRDSDYVVRVFAFPATPDSSIRFAGGDDYVYRLTLTTGPFVDHALPLAVPREETQVELGGWNLGPRAVAIVPPLSAEVDPLTPPDGPLAWIWRADAAGALAVAREQHATTIGAHEVGVPATVSGRLATLGQAHTYSFMASKNQKLRLKVVAKGLGFPTDAVIAVLDDAGKVLAEVDDTGRDDRDPQLDFAPPEDGKYRVVVRDLANRGDLRMVYRMTVEGVQPDFSLALPADSFVLEKDKPLEIPVNITVRDGLKEAIEFHAIGLPAGVTAEPVKFEPSGDSPMPDTGGGRRGRRSGTPQPSGPSAKLVLKADATVNAGGTPIRIEGRTASGLVRSARFPLNLPLAGAHHAVWITVK